MYINVAVHYVRPAQVAYARDTLEATIQEVIQSEDLDLEVDPSLVRECIRVQLLFASLYC
jgi:Ras GTPase-activating-like protein IQGAP2/3